MHQNHVRDAAFQQLAFCGSSSCPFFGEGKKPCSEAVMGGLKEMCVYLLIFYFRKIIQE